MKQNLQLFLNKIQTQSKYPGECVAVAFTSSVSGEGVSHVTESFGVQLARRLGKRILVADAQQLARLNITQYRNVPQHCFPTNVRNLWSLPAAEIEAETETNHEQRLQNSGAKNDVEIAWSNLQTLRFAFEYILLDCPALTASEEAAFLIPVTDGVVLVVEADQTKSEQIQNAQKMIEMSDGTLLGCILNKRQYTVPGWLYNKL